MTQRRSIVGNVLVALLDHGPDPNTNIRGHNMRQSESCQELPSVNVESGVHEYKVHLAECEQRLENGIDAS